MSVLQFHMKIHQQDSFVEFLQFDFRKAESFLAEKQSEFRRTELLKKPPPAQLSEDNSGNPPRGKERQLR